MLGAFRIARNGNSISDVRLVFGGMAATIKRAANAEAALRGQAYSEAAIEAAAEALAKDFEPISDMRASATTALKYRAICYAASGSRRGPTIHCRPTKSRFGHATAKGVQNEHHD